MFYYFFVHSDLKQFLKSTMKNSDFQFLFVVVDVDVVVGDDDEDDELEVDVVCFDSFSDIFAYQLVKWCRDFLTDASIRTDNESVVFVR